MKDCALIDFDRTLISIDSTKFLILELIKLSPGRIIYASYFMLKLLLANDQKEVQINKNKLIGCLISGFKPKDLDIALRKFSHKINKFIRPNLLKRIHDHYDNNVMVLVVTASPDFAVKACLHNLPVYVVGTNYQLHSGKFASMNAFQSCYGIEKVLKVKDWQKKNKKNLNFIESWSDSFSDYPIASFAKKRFWIGGRKLKKEILVKDPNGIFVPYD